MALRSVWLTFALAACSSGTTPAPTDAAPAGNDVADAAPPNNGVDLPIVQPADPAAAARGEATFTQHTLGRGLIPAMALRYLWLVWGGGPPDTDSAFWAAFRARYGMYPAPYENGPYPLGLHAADATMVALDCMACHATVTAGRTLIGVGNSQLDLQSLFDDLAQLRTVATSVGVTVPPLPYTITNITGAAGANDAMGLSMYLATQYDPRNPVVHTSAGFQQAGAWWTLRYRRRMYLDGSGQAGGYRTMMGMLLASGETLAQLQARDAEFADIYQYILSLAPPRWDLTALDPARRDRGRQVFDATCASCHGVHSGPAAAFPDTVVARESVGTDPVRAQSFDANDVAWVNSTWFGGNGAAPYAMAATGGYFAPPLAGVWATAPYLHNGSVPDLASVLDSRVRPARWRRTGSDAAAYDTERVGWRYTTVDASPGAATVDARRTYDTTRPGLANTGHTYGDPLTDAQRSDLLEYLRGL